MPVSEAKRHARAGRDARADAVAAQYAAAADAAGYAAAHDGWGPTARYFHSRLYAVQQAVRACLGGDLLDAGCGPGMFVRQLLDSRPGDFRITACDQSPAMVAAARTRAGEATGTEFTVTRIEDMPFPAGSFDVVLAMGVLEYADAPRAVRELARVVRPGGLVIVTMLNPLSPYRLFEWGVYWPALGVLGRVERLLGVRAGRRHGVPRSGIHALSQRRLRAMMRDARLQPHDVVSYDVTPLLPPLDRVVRRRSRRWRTHPEKTVGCGVRGWMGTAYLVAARRIPDAECDH